MVAAAARELFEKLTKSTDVAVSGEMRGVDHDEHRIRGKPSNAFLDPCRRDMKRPPLTAGDMRGDAVRLVQWHRLQILPEIIPDATRF